MPETKDHKLEIQNLLNALDPQRLSKEDFVNAFEKVVQLVLQNQNSLQKAVENLERTYAHLVDKVNNDHASNFQALKGQVNDLFVGDQLKRMSGETKRGFEKLQGLINSSITQKLQEVDNRIAKVKDGYTPIKGKDYFDGISGKDAQFDPSEIKQIKKDIEFIKKHPRGKMGMKKIRSIQSIDLTASVDGTTTTFTLPQDTTAVLGVWSSQFPISFRQNVDWTFTGRTLTLVANQVGTPQTGQTLFALVETLFYA